VFCRISVIRKTTVTGVRFRRSAVQAVAVLGMVSCPVGVRGQATDQPELKRAIAAYDAGELQQATSLLNAAPALLGRHDSAIRSLYSGLIQFALGDRNRARQSFAQAVRAEPSLRLDPAVHSPGRVAAFDEARAEVVEEFRAAAVAEDRDGDAVSALAAWRVVLVVSSGDEQAAGRIATIEQNLRAAESKRDVERRETVSEPDSARPSPASPAEKGDRPAEPRLKPGQALAMGLVVPGLGQFYTGHALRGVVVLGVVGGAVAAGMLSERLEVECGSVPVNDECPPGDVLDRQTRRPYLVPSIAAAAGVALVAAIEAFVGARNSNADRKAAADDSGGTGLRVLRPAMTVGRRVEANLVRLRFR